MRRAPRPNRGTAMPAKAQGGAALRPAVHTLAFLCGSIVPHPPHAQGSLVPGRSVQPPNQRSSSLGHVLSISSLLVLHGVHVCAPGLRCLATRLHCQSACLIGCTACVRGDGTAIVLQSLSSAKEEPWLRQSSSALRKTRVCVAASVN